MSKGGLYAHFSSKEAVFEALLARHLDPAPLDVDAVVDGALSPRHLAERIVNHLYASLADTATVSTMRLLLAEAVWKRMRCRNMPSARAQELHCPCSVIPSYIDRPPRAFLVSGRSWEAHQR